MRLSGLPGGVQQAKKKPVLAYELFFEDGGEGGRFLAGSSSVQLAVASCRTPSGLLIPPGGCYMRKKKPVLAYELFFKYGGEGGIRTPDTLPYTHFPGVLLQPLGHLTILSFPLLPGTGANLGKYVSPVNQLFKKIARLAKLQATCSLNARESIFLSPFPFSHARLTKFAMLANQ